MSDGSLDINLLTNQENMKNTNIENQNEKQEIMILAIELGDNEKKFLKIYNDSKPEQLAYDFCLQNNLDFDSLQELTEEIKNALRQKVILANSIANTNNNNILNNQVLTESNINKENTIENLSNLLNNNNNNSNKVNINNNNSELKNKNKYSSNTKIKSKNINSIYKRNTNPNSSTSSKHKRNLNHLSQTVSSQTKKRISKSNISVATNENLNIIPNSNNINQNVNNQNNNNNIENELDINISQSNYNPSNTTGNDYRKNRPLTAINQDNYMLNYGERLYHKGLKLKERTDEKIQKIKQDKEKNDKKNCTFKPKVNNISYAALTNRYNNKLSYNDEDNIINYKDYVNNKIEYLKEKYDKNQVDFPFVPKINKRSITMDKNNIGHINQIGPRYEQLYRNYKKKELDIHNLSNKRYDKNVLFKPKINVYNSELLNLPFNERQKAYDSKTNERKKKMKELIENPIDNKTGQKFFSPVINTNYERKYGINNNFNTFENLYNDRQKKEAKINFLTEKIQNEENPNLIYVNHISNNLYNEQKINSFKKIFKILDKDQDGIVSKFHIESDELPNNLNKIFMPIIEELKQDNQTLTEDEFVAASFRLFETLNFLQKRDIIDFGLNKKKKNDEELQFTFAPKINKDYNLNINKREIDDRDKELLNEKQSYNENESEKNIKTNSNNQDENNDKKEEPNETNTNGEKILNFDDDEQ